MWFSPYVIIYNIYNIYNRWQMNLFTRLHLHYWRHLLVSLAFCKFSSIQLVHTDRLVLWMLTWLYFQFIYFIQQHSVLTLQFTLFTYFIQYQISQAVFLRVNYWAGLSHIHLDDKVRRFSLYPPNVVRNCPNVRAVILSNNIIKYRGWR